MTPKRHSAGLVMAAALVLVTSSIAAAQPSTQPPAPVDTGHSVWRDALIGLGVGTATGLIVGKMRENFHNAECRVLDCNRVLEMDTLGPLGAATGAALGFVVHRIRHSGEARSSVTASSSAQRQTTRSPTVMLSPSYSRTRKAILLRAEF